MPPKNLQHIFGLKKNYQTGEYKIKINAKIKNSLKKKKKALIIRKIMNGLGHIWRYNDITKNTLNGKQKLRDSGQTSRY